MSNKKNEDSWNKLSDHYQAAQIISLENIHYNPYGPGERELGIIGDVTGLDLLEVGCGGGQNSIVMAKWGAKSVVGLDQSEKQLEYARRLAESVGVDVEFIQSDMQDMSILEASSFDLIVSMHAMNYASDIQQVFNECSRLLKLSGRFVTCMSHPIWLVFGEAMELNDFSKIVNYYKDDREIWDWEDYDGKSIATFESTGWRLGQIINGLISAEFRIEGISEPKGYTREEIETVPLESMPYRESKDPYYPFVDANQIFPNSIIVSAKKEK
ncbi:MAG: class I SAM-dependent methyltransferase [Candidatus Thorarchaeota archaeon]|jgi:ubiquinone/menaquinone biosynthesis C-methylase UbiE